ncbi:IS4 family transposase, partial [Lusitaniella coriacea LEGE 07157]|nr:IS4 family transposase [Lusitaniella coriacea LEGE 07157]
HGRRAKSIFRYGFDHLRSIVNDLDLKHSEFLQALHFLSCT